MAGRIIKVAGLVILAAALSAPFASAMRVAGDGGGSVSTQPASRYLNTPASDQGMQAGTQSIGQAKDEQAAKTFKLPLAPDDRPGTAAVTTPLVIPYLSHGVGVDATQFSGSTTASTAPAPSSGDSFNWGSVGIGAGGIAALALAIALLTGLVRRGRNTDVAVS